jgi:SAM-dependent methyltransferase
MCNSACLRFGSDAIAPVYVRGRRVLEVGALDVNGSLRSTLEAFAPAEYCGVDLVDGPGVDVVCDAVELIDRFGAERWDVVVCTEMLEHVWDWRRVVSNLKRSLAAGGMLVLTTRSPGFPYHPFPFDFWRYDTLDARHIFGDLEQLRVEGDPEMPGVFVTGVRGESFVERDLTDCGVFSVLRNERVTSMTLAPLEEFVATLEGTQTSIAEQLSSHRRLLAALARPT